MTRLFSILSTFALVTLQYCRGSSATTGLKARTHPIALTGAPQNESGFQSMGFQSTPRRNIHDFVKLNDGKTANLFLLAFRQVYNKTEDDPLSFWQIAGIHGRPYQAWNHETRTGSGGGWAAHRSTLFLTWHRAFLAFFEQLIRHNAEQILQEATPQFQEMYEGAFGDLKLPYFDWTSNSGQMPDILTQPKWNVVLPDTFIALIDNPLHQSMLRHGTFDDPELFPYSPLNTWNRSIRSPDSQKPDAVSGIWQIQQRLKVNVNPLQAKLKALLLDDKFATWPAFSNEGWDGATGESIEALHDDFHQLIGGSNGGHMYYYDYAAFDPIFYLSHVNLDRLCAMWQVLHPDQWVTPQANENGTFGIPAKTIESTVTPLRPFRKENGTFWTSGALRDITVFDYTYPELQLEQGNGTRKRDLREHIRGQIERLYGST